MAFALFKDRQDAGRQLAKSLNDFRGKDAIVLALPRGGVVIGVEIAKILELPLDIIVTRKIGAPESAELAIGAIDVDGDSVWDGEAMKNINKEWLEQQIEKEKQEAKRRQYLYRAGRGPLDLAGKIAIIVDDGIATGLTMKAAIKYAKKLGAKKIVVASPLSPQEIVNDLKRVDLSAEALAKADEVRVIDTPEFFWAIGQFYENFPQVEDEEVIEILKYNNEKI